MRTIEVSTEVFAKIWANRLDGEENENAILVRLLGVSTQSGFAGRVPLDGRAPSSDGKVLWRDDVRSALASLGGESALGAIYEKVRQIRLEKGRSVPMNLQAIVRRELEYNSSDSNVFRGQHDWFRSSGGIGKGVWSLRADTVP